MGVGSVSTCYAACLMSVDVKQNKDRVKKILAEDQTRKVALLAWLVCNLAVPIWYQHTESELNRYQETSNYVKPLPWIGIVLAAVGMNCLACGCIIGLVRTNVVDDTIERLAGV